MNRLSSLLALALLRPATAAADAVVYKVDADHSGVNFKIRHFVSNVSGRFRDFAGVIRYDKQNPAASSVEFTVKAASIDTASNDRDEDLRSKSFFEVAKYPTLTFTSTRVVAKDADTLEVTGSRTMDGVTREITLAVQILGTESVHGGEQAGCGAAFTADSKELAFNWNTILDTGPTLGD